MCFVIDCLFGVSFLCMKLFIILVVLCVGGNVCICICVVYVCEGMNFVDFFFSCGEYLEVWLFVYVIILCWLNERW